MKYFIKLSQVFICIILFLLIAHLYEERDDIFNFEDEETASEDISASINTINKVEDNAPSSDALDGEKSDELEASTDLENPEPIDEQIPEAIDEVIIQEETFNYEMKPINPHSIGHIYEMLEVIENFKLSPHDDQSLLIKQLSTRNFMHLEDELEEKNLSLYKFLKSLMTSVEEHEHFSDTESIIVILDKIYVILDNITKIE